MKITAQVFTRQMNGYWILILVSQLLVACVSTTSTEEKSTLNEPPPSRHDLYDSKAVIPVTADHSPKTEQEALVRANREDKLGNLDQALYLYVQSLDFNANNAMTLYHIARINGIKGYIQLAYQAYNEALVLDPEMMMAHGGLGLINMEKRQHADARENLNKAVHLDQNRLAQSGSKPLKNALYPLDNDSPLRVYNALAILHDLNNNHEQARDHYKLARLKEPHSVLITTNLGYSYYLSGNISLAEVYLKQAIKYDPSFDRAWTNLGLVYVRKGQYVRALSAFEHTMEPADALNDLGYFLMLEGQYEQAVALFEKAINRSPSYFELAQKNLKRAAMELKSQQRH